MVINLTRCFVSFQIFKKQNLYLFIQDFWINISKFINKFLENFYIKYKYVN
jgi:hypothetical protein